jgi:SEC-C motif-containing protein
VTGGTAAPCPCLSGETYGECCGRFHEGFAGGVWPATAVELMRSRYSAFVAGRPDYLLATWHPSTRPATLVLDEDIRWRRLDVVRTAAGGPFDDRGTVEFAAHYLHDGERGVQREVSRFAREDSRWYYVDGG